MSAVELKKRLIDKIQTTQDERILEEAFRLLHQDWEDTEVYRLRDEQKTAVAEAREQMKTGQWLTDEKANQEIDEWLNK